MQGEHLKLTSESIPANETVNENLRYMECYLKIEIGRH